MSYADRLQQALAASNKSRKDLALAVGCSVQNIGMILTNAGKKDQQFSAVLHAKAAKFLKVDPYWLATGQGEFTPGTSAPDGEIDLTNNPEYPAIRRVKFKLSAGATGFAVEYQEHDDSPIVFQREWFTSKGYSPRKMFAARVSNGSMEPGLYDGDTIVINTEDTTLKDGQVFAMNYEGEMVVKRLVRDQGQWWLASDNPDQTRYPRKSCGDGVTCIGRVVQKMSMHL